MICPVCGLEADRQIEREETVRTPEGRDLGWKRVIKTYIHDDDNMQHRVPVGPVFRPREPA